MRANKIAQGKLQGQPPIDTVVSMQEKENGDSILSFHSGTTIVDVETNATYSKYSYEGSFIQKSPNGFKAIIHANKEKDKSGTDYIIVKGKIRKIGLQQKSNTPIHLFINDKLVQTGKQIHWSRKSQAPVASVQEKRKPEPALPPPPKPTLVPQPKPTPSPDKKSKVKQPSPQEGGFIQILSDYWPYAVGGVGGLLLLYKLIK